MKIAHSTDIIHSVQYPYHELAVSIILRALRDYRLLGARLRDDMEAEKKKSIEDMMKAISRFFLSDWYGILSGRDDGDKILEKLDQEVFGDD